MFEDLSNAKIISLDIETRDESISKDLGPGEQRGGNNYIVGVALATNDGYQAYYPVAHEPGNNLDQDKVYDYLRIQLGRKNQHKLGTNIQYDVRYLRKEGVPVCGKLYDIQLAETLLDENKSSQGYALNEIAKKYLGKGKSEDLLYEYLARQFGGKPTRNQQAKNIWRAPPSIVEDYALGDVRLPLEIYVQQRTLLEQQNLEDLFELETDLIPMLIDMRFRGIRVDAKKVSELKSIYDAKIYALTRELKGMMGEEINLNSGKQLSEYFLTCGLDGEKTKTGQLKTDKGALQNLSHPVSEKLIELKGLLKIAGTYLDGYLSEHLINGRIHCQLHSFFSDKGGTVTGRFSSSDPNLQNIPKRHGTVIRSCFLPEEGELWSRKDWSQIEPRLMVHYASGALAGELQQAYQQDAHTDFYTYAQKLILEKTGKDIPRDYVKNISLGLMYGMGPNKLARQLGITRDEVNSLFKTYQQTFPYIIELSKRVASRAAQRGYIHTLAKRRRRFPLWEPSQFGLTGEALPHDEALEKYGAIRRAGTYKALNALLQGGCADILKIAAHKMMKSGVLNVLGAPLMLVHDEFDFSVPNTKEGLEADAEVTHIMQTCVDLKVPLQVSSEHGSNWGELSE